MAELGYRAMAMGNHDFDGGGLPNFRAKLAAHAPNLDILCANVRKACGGKVDIFHAYRVYSVGGVRVAVVGLLGEDAWLVTAAPLRAGLVLEEPLSCARRVVGELRAAGVADVYLCASHTGVHRGDTKLAQEGLFDAIFSGHEHTTITDHEWSLVPNGLQNGLGGTLLQPGWYGGRHVARLELHVGTGGSAAGALACLTSASDVIDARYEEDAKVQALLAPFKSSFEVQVKRVVGSSGSSAFVKQGLGLPARHICADSERQVAGREPGSSCPLGALVAEAFRTYTSIDGCGTRVADTRVSGSDNRAGRADFAMVNAGAIRAGLPGYGEPVRWEHIDGVWPWPDDGRPVAFKLTGAAVRELLQASNIARYALGSGGMCYLFSRLRYTVCEDKGADPARSTGPLRLARVWIGNRELNDRAIYTGVTSSYCLEEDVLATLQIKGVERLLSRVVAATRAHAAADSSDQATEGTGWEPTCLKDYLLQYVAEHSPLEEAA